MVKQKLPKWFDGTIYKKGDTVRNRFSGEEIELTAIELSMYDFIMGCQIIMGMIPGNVYTEDPLRVIKELRKGLDWFRKNNVKAYMTLLD